MNKENKTLLSRGISIKMLIRVEKLMYVLITKINVKMNICC